MDKIITAIRGAIRNGRLTKDYLKRNFNDKELQQFKTFLENQLGALELADILGAGQKIGLTPFEMEQQKTINKAMLQVVNNTINENNGITQVNTKNLGIINLASN